MTYHYSATGDRIEDVVAATSRNLTVDRQESEHVPALTRPRDPEIVARCNELRRILAESRARRQAAA